MVWYKDVMKVYGLGPNEEILTFERGEDDTIRTKVELLHHVLVLHRDVDINVGLEWQYHHRTARSRLTTGTCSETKIFFTSQWF